MQIALAGLDSKFAEKLYQIEKMSGKRIKILSGFRSVAKQKQIWADSNHGMKYPAARPGYSRHNYGFAIDVDQASTDILNTYGPQFGITNGNSFNDPNHFDDLGDYRASGKNPDAPHMNTDGATIVNTAWYNPNDWVKGVMAASSWTMSAWPYILLVVLGAVIITIGVKEI